MMTVLLLIGLALAFWFWRALARLLLEVLTVAVLALVWLVSMTVRIVEFVILAALAVMAAVFLMGTGLAGFVWLARRHAGDALAILNPGVGFVAFFLAFVIVLHLRGLVHGAPRLMPSRTRHVVLADAPFMEG